MHYVYVLRSVGNPDKTYVGFTNSIDNRLHCHNDGKSIYTAKYKPWILVGYVAFQEEFQAISFEKYLKSGSGKVFLKKHFLQASGLSSEAKSKARA
ncbi:GIY-YIG nuclease family protein [Candidatus Babeliales bacterium]|nr:GIY-YIG nuclease family protein [Candidatus Babeliales bacterium]